MHFLKLIYVDIRIIYIFTLFYIILIIISASSNGNSSKGKVV